MISSFFYNIAAMLDYGDTCVFQTTTTSASYTDNTQCKNYSPFFYTCLPQGFVVANTNTTAGTIKWICG